MPPPEHRKFLQINHVVRVMRSAIAELSAAYPVVRLLDAGCGRSYLTLLLAWCAKHRWNQRIEVLGVDRNAELIEECRRRTATAQLDDVVTFEARSLDALELAQPVHGVFALHACDTATCDAIALGIRLDAHLIAVAPCCQAELARGWSTLDGPGAFAPIWRMPHLRRETAAHLTDAMRVLLLRAAGYEVTPMEFIAAEHTKKNTLIRALRRGSPDTNALAEYAALVSATGGVGIALAGVLGRRTLMHNKPKWWNQEHDSAWDRVKDAMKRDWEQTKSDLTRGRKGTDLDQDVGDTVKQAAGKSPIPPMSQRTPPDVDDKDWKNVEEDHRYGVGARAQYGDHDWDDRLESKLKEEWNDLKSGRTWDEVKSSVRRGWDRGPRPRR
jgi:SAM-dependent methyltransferase